MAALMKFHLFVTVAACQYRHLRRHGALASMALVVAPGRIIAEIRQSWRRARNGRELLRWRRGETSARGRLMS